MTVLKKAPDLQPARMLSRRTLVRGALGASLAGVAGCSRGGGGQLGGGGGGGEVTELVVPTHKSPWLAAYKAIAARYQQEKGVRITLREFPYDGLRTQQVNAVQQGSSAFDVYQLDEPWIGQFYDGGWVTPLRDLDSAFKPEGQILTYDALLAWDTSARTTATSGVPYGLPLNGNVDLLIYRKDLYDELGLQVPTTWEQARANAEQARGSGKVPYGHVMRTQAAKGGAGTSYEFMHVFYGYGADWFVAEGKDWTPAVNTPEAVRAAEMFRALAQTGHPQPQTIGQAEAIALMQSGQALQTHVVAASAEQLLDPAKSKVADKLGFAQVPAGAGGKPAPTSGVWSLCVPAGIPDDRAKAALEFITWLLSKPAQEEFTRQGGIPTRDDCYDLPDAPATAKQYLPAVRESVPNARRHIRYVFAAQMLEVTEQVISRIAAGAVPARAGMEDMQRRLTKVVKDAGFLK